MASKEGYPIHAGHLEGRARRSRLDEARRHLSAGYPASALAKHRRRFRHEELSLDAPAKRRDATDLAASSNEIQSRIDAALQSLPEMQRIVARLSLVEDCDHDEIAAMMKLSEGTVRSHLSLARAKLRQQLADLYE